MENIDEVKRRRLGVLKYRLSNASVYVSPGGIHYIDYLDDMGDVDSADVVLTDQDVSYIERLLQSNRDRFDSQVSIVLKYVDVIGKKVLDVGSGGGLFLSLLREKGANVMGCELNPARSLYSKKKYKLAISTQPIEDSDFLTKHAGSFDCVTMWDVIEHVNYPFSTINASKTLLAWSGYLFIDTPCRDCFYHIFGDLTYRLTKGLFPTFLNSMYSAHPFGHKQIFTRKEMVSILNGIGFEVIDVHSFHELSFPYRFYLKKMFKSDFLGSSPNLMENSC